MKTAEGKIIVSKSQYKNMLRPTGTISIESFKELFDRITYMSASVMESTEKQRYLIAKHNYKNSALMQRELGNEERAEKIEEVLAYINKQLKKIFN